MKAIIRLFAPDPKNPTVLATVEFHEGKVVVVSDDVDFKGELEDRGIIGRDGKKFGVENGAEFIREMPYHFKGSYIRAEVVE